MYYGLDKGLYITLLNGDYTYTRISYVLTGQQTVYYPSNGDYT